MDWRGGPFAEEIVIDLLSDVEGLESLHAIDPGTLFPCFDWVGNLNAVWLYDLRIRFRPYRRIYDDTGPRRIAMPDLSGVRRWGPPRELCGEF